jgi:predicted NAD-dependent protein-ADP-ribosyltransferase YbiA (DUF1768 family)
MVKSKLDPTVEYAEARDIDPTDLNFEANLYETQIYDQTIVFALGQPKYTYVDNNIIFYPMYLIVNDALKNQIGLYEILSTKQSTILDEDGDVDLNKFHKPLLFAFTYDYIKAKPTEAKPTEAKPTEAKPTEAKPTEALSKKKDKTTKPAATTKPTATTNTKPAATTKPKPIKTDWIKTFLNDDGYDIIDTPHDGHCFFSVLQLALKEQGQTISIDEMRKILADHATEDMFQVYKLMYTEQTANVDNLTREIKNITARFTALTEKVKTTKDRNLQMGFSAQSDAIKTKQDELKRVRAQTKENLKDFAFMAGVDNLSMLKIKIRTNDYWADSWAISVLEKQLNLKTIIFSELTYAAGDEMNVLQCGHFYEADTELLEPGPALAAQAAQAQAVQAAPPAPAQAATFEPSFYVLTCHQGNHYQLITYNEKQSFTFPELPEAVKQLVLDKCLEKNSGAYSLIPDFVAYAAGPLKNAAAPELQPALKHNLEEISSDLYDNATVFRFYSKSADKPAPGKGQGESLGAEGPEAYVDLRQIPQWRKKLANSWPAEFTLDNHKWLSVEHYYQGNKYKNNNKEFYLQFSLDSKDSAIAKDADLAKAAGGKSGKFKGEQVRPKGVSLDPDFYERKTGEKYSRGEQVREAAMRAKFTQQADLKALLIATKKAKLEHIARGEAPDVFKDLMRVRRDLQMA